MPSHPLWTPEETEHLKGCFWDMPGPELERRFGTYWASGPAYMVAHLYARVSQGTPVTVMG